MDNNSFKDFDAFFNEMEKKPAVQIKVFGEMYDLPSELPATPILQTYRASKSGDAQMSESMQMEIAIELLGEENVSEWCKKGMTLTQLVEVMKWAVQEYTGAVGVANEGTGTDNSKK